MLAAAEAQDLVVVAQDLVVDLDHPVDQDHLLDLVVDQDHLVDLVVDQDHLLAQDHHLLRHLLPLRPPPPP